MTVYKNLIEFCMKEQIVFFEQDVYPFAFDEEWIVKNPIYDSENNFVDYETVINENAINDTLKRMHANIIVTVLFNDIIVENKL